MGHHMWSKVFKEPIGFTLLHSRLGGKLYQHSMLSENVGCPGHGYTMQVWDTNSPPSFSERERAKSARSHSECLPFKETVSLCRKWVTLAKGCYKNISGGLHVDSACIMCMYRCVCMHAGVKNTGIYQKDPPPQAEQITTVHKKTPPPKPGPLFTANSESPSEQNHYFVVELCLSSNIHV